MIFFFISVPWSLYRTVSIISILRLYNDFIELLTCCTVINLGNVGQLRVDLRKHSFMSKPLIYIKYNMCNNVFNFALLVYLITTIAYNKIVSCEVRGGSRGFEPMTLRAVAKRKLPLTRSFLPRHIHELINNKDNKTKCRLY